MNSSGSMFGLHGIAGMLIAVVLLLSILAGLTIWGLGVQQASATKPYVVTGNAVPNPKTIEDVYANLKEVRMYDAEAKNRAFKDVK